jgi:glycosyltransferase involved in cell wall biosynthesis
MFHFAKLSGCEIKVVSPVPYYPAININPKWYQYCQIKKKEVMDGIEIFHPRYPLVPKMSIPFNGLSLFLSSLNLVKKIKQTFPFDLIDGHFIYPDGFAAVLLGKTLKKPVVLSARGSDINEFARFRYIRPMIKYALNAANHAISVCDALKHEMVKLGIQDNKINVIPNGVDTEQFKPMDKREARQRLSIPNHGKIIVSVGALIPRKGFDILLDALYRLSQNNSDIYLYIIGEGPYRSFLEQQIKNLNLGQRVYLIGEIPNTELETWYNAADVSCLTSSREGWANVIMESLACGTPVVATRVWGAPEILTSSEVGILVDRSPESICDGLKKALGKSWNRIRIRAYVENRNWFKVADEVKAVFCSVLDQYSNNNHIK